MQIPQSDLDQLLSAVRTTMENVVKLRAQPQAQSADPSPGDPAAEDAAADTFREIDRLAEARFREYADAFEKIWDSLADVLAGYSGWQRRRADCVVECTWGGRHRASKRLFRVGLTAAVEVQTPLAFSSHISLLPPLLTKGMGVGHLCDASTGSVTTTTDLAGILEMGGQPGVVKVLIWEAMNFCAAVCQAMLIIADREHHA